MLFSILIANYNNGSFFKESYDSIINQTHTDFEVIIVDDASTDDSIAIISKLIANDSRFRLLINEKNNGAGFTKKQCVDNASGILCGYLDPDDALTTNALEVMVLAHQKNPSASLIYSTNYNCDANLKVISTKNDRIQQPKGVSVIEQTCVSHFATFKRENYLKSVQVNPNYKRAVDVDLYCVLEEVGDIVFLNKPLYYYRIHENGISRNTNTHKAEYWELIIKHDHAQRKGLNGEDAFQERINYYKSDVSSYSNFTLIKIAASRLIGRFLKKKTR